MNNKRIDLTAKTSDGITLNLTLAIEDDGLLVNFVVKDAEGNHPETLHSSADPFGIIQILNDRIGAITILASAMQDKAKAEAR